MKSREQARLLMRKAAQDEALLDVIVDSDTVSDEVFGFHCQQAAEKLMKALLSRLGIRFRKTHELGSLALLLTEYGCPVPSEFDELDRLTPFGAVYRYEDFDSPLQLDRPRVRKLLMRLRAWIENQLATRDTAGKRDSM
jgi:HEPN domain-containing protein